ncbi:carbon starvation CstA family protein [Limobrevibacterium gyesilva]|uniref:Carbon starvation protein A n=1 Tax=Limobrevibacterium gyesilva TaxID=2991712 RepID=A0AA41YM43_9PROT|nr:carbon starvation CstA family protein [Limobrevibacterium gyesilva]MCW3475245.1 carbon starvation protein A [Limobrevibacterium gyesilva]
MTLQAKLMWAGLAVLGAIAFGIVALSRGEPVNAAWLVIASACIYFIAYRFYALYIVGKVFAIDRTRQTPAYRHNDGLDYVPTNRYVLFGHHFAAIAGAGPLVGPVLAAQMGYLPGTLWILAGAVFAGAVQDMTVLFLSTRRDGRSLGDMIRSEMGPAAGAIAGIGVLLICVIILAVLALVVVKALVGSPWGTFAVFATIPIALLMGIYVRFLRPGRIGEMSAIGAVLLLLALIYGRTVSETPALAAWFNLPGDMLALLIIGYGFVASVLPVWLLLAPRDYLSTFLKVGTILLLAIGIIVVRPDMQMSAVTRFIDGTGPVWAGSVFPFLFITIACGAVSGWHSLISSGTTPKMIENEDQICFIGYGGMLTESFVAMMAIISASVIHPGVYFAMNSSAGLIGTDPAQAAQVITGWGFAVTPDMLTQIARDVGETSIMSRTGGAPTLAVGMASILSEFLGGRVLMGIWYHFAILFEALFILTTVDAGTRVCRFMIQDLVGNVVPAFKATESWANNIIGSALSCALWGYFLYQGVIDPLGGIWTLWPLFGTANQMLAAIALTLCTVVLFKMKRQRYAWVTVVPTAWLVVCTVTAGLQKVFSPDPAVGFVSHARLLGDAVAAGKVQAPAKSLAEMNRIIFNDYVDATLAALFVAIVVATVVYGLITSWKALGNPKITAIEVGGAGVLAGGSND